MTVDICFVCLSPISIPGEDAKKNVEVYKNFLQFAKVYLKIPSAACFLEAVTSARNSFCESCTGVVKNVCEFHVELVQAKLRLSAKLAELGDLLEGSKKGEESTSTEHLRP